MKVKFICVILSSIAFYSSAKAENSDLKYNLLNQEESASILTPKKNFAYLGASQSFIVFGPNFMNLNLGYGRNGIFISKDSFTDFFSVGANFSIGKGILALGRIKGFGYILSFPFRYGLEWNIDQIHSSIGTNALFGPAYTTAEKKADPDDILISQPPSLFKEIDNGDGTFKRFYIFYGLETFLKIKLWHPLDFTIRANAGYATSRKELLEEMFSGFEVAAQFSF